MRISIPILFALMLVTGAAAFAQSFTVSASPRRQDFPAGADAVFNVAFTSAGGFDGTINFEVYARSLPWAAVQISANKINPDYRKGITVTVKRQNGHFTGTHMIVVHGWNGSLHSYDTCYLEVQPTRGWEHYTSANSPLPSDVIYKMVVDKEGVGWIATDKGLARFDKQNWRVYTHKDFGGFTDNVLSVAVDSSNAVWITVSDSSGIARLKDGVWTSWYMPLADPRPVDTLPHFPEPYYGPLNVRSLEAGTNGYIYGSSNNQLMRFDGTLWTRYEQNVGTILLDGSNTVWSIVGNDNVVKYDGSFWSSGVIDIPGYLRLHSLAVAPDNSIWALGRDAIIRHGRDSTHSITNGTRDYPGPHPSSVSFDRNGHVWIGSSDGGSDYAYGEGVVRYDGDVATRYTVYNAGLPDNRVRDVKAGPDGTIWMRTIAPGIVLFNVERASSVERTTAASAVAGIAAISPNPVADRGTITITLSRRDQVRLTLHNTLGEEVATVFNGPLDAGEKLVSISAAGLPSGTYLLKLVAGSAIVTQTLVISH